MFTLSSFCWGGGGGYQPQMVDVFVKYNPSNNPNAYGTGYDGLAYADNLACSYDPMNYKISNNYYGTNKLWLEFGSTEIYCADHDHQAGINISNAGIESLAFPVDINSDNFLWARFNSQDEHAPGTSSTKAIFYKAEKWFMVGTFPTDPNYPYEFSYTDEMTSIISTPSNPNDIDYGCGPNDLN